MSDVIQILRNKMKSEATRCAQVWALVAEGDEITPALEAAWDEYQKAVKAVADAEEAQWEIA